MYCYICHWYSWKRGKCWLCLFVLAIETPQKALGKNLCKIHRKTYVSSISNSKCLQGLFLIKLQTFRIAILQNTYTSATSPLQIYHLQYVMFPSLQSYSLQYDLHYNKKILLPEHLCFLQEPFSWTYMIYLIINFKLKYTPFIFITSQLYLWILMIN